MEVSMWMTPAPRCATEDERLASVAEAMHAGRFRQMPVVDGDGRLLGIVTQRDIAEHKGYLDTTKVSAAVTEPALSIRPEDSIELAAQMLLDRKIGGLPVVDAEHRVLGILTTTDLLRGLLASIGGVEGAVRIDCTTDGPGLADAVRIVESAGGTVLALGLLGAAAEVPRHFFVRVAARGAHKATDALQRAGFAPSAAASQT